ncbi:FAD-dependent monooxygenase [Streptomyces mirabilis]|nr:FAD-dependent monooxygenase [Streptomyces mirabilis]
MGLDAAVRAACTDTAGAHTVDADGQVLETFRADDDGGDGFIADIEILRGDLSRVLYDDTRDGVEYVFGDRIAELAQDADGVDVVFAGGNRRRFDLVVGADGLHSELRAMVFGPHERFLRHLEHVLAFYSVPNEFGLDRWLLEYRDQESGRSALLRPIQDATRAMAMFYFPSADFDVDHRDVAAQKVLLRERMAGLGWLTPDILAHLDDTPDFYLDQVAQVVMDRWSSGRVGLLGDAAFSSSPMSGQGTGLALVGAYLLAGELAAAGWDPDAGFARYEARMRSFVEANQEIGRLNARSRDLPGQTPSRAPISPANGSPSWSGARSTASSCPTTRGCRTPQPGPDRRSPRRPSRRCHITCREGPRFSRTPPDDLRSGRMVRVGAPVRRPGHVPMRRCWLGKLTRSMRFHRAGVSVVLSLAWSALTGADKTIGTSTP